MILTLIKINSFSVERGSGGDSVLFWYHRQFIEAAQERYLSGNTAVSVHERTTVHRNVAEYFMGKWHGILKMHSYKTSIFAPLCYCVNLGTEKPFTTKQGESGSSKRDVTAQPLKRGDSYNMRKLEELPRQLLKAEMYQEFEQEIAFNLEWHFEKMNALSFG